MRLKLLGLFWLFSLVRSDNPGVLFQLHKNSIVRIKNKLVPKIYDIIRHFEIDKAIDDSGIKVTNLKVDLEQISASNLDFDFESDVDSLGIVLKQLFIRFKFDIKINKVVKLSGRGDGRFGLSFAKYRTSAKPLDHGNPRPFVDVKFEGMKIDRGAFNLRLDIAHLPDFIVKLVIKIFKDKILDEISKEITSKARSEAEKQTQEAINLYYPLSVDLPYQVSLSTKLTSKIYLDKDFIFFPMDGIFYNRDRGYSRPVNPKPLDLHKEDQKLAVTYTTEASANYLYSAVAGMVFQFTFHNALFTLSVDPNDQPIIFEEGVMKLNGALLHGKVEYLGYFVSISPKVQLKASFAGYNLAEQKLEFDIYDLQVLSISYESDSTVMEWLLPFVPIALKTFFRTKRRVNYSISWVKLPFGMTLQDLVIHECKENVRVSIDIAAFKEENKEEI